MSPLRASALLALPVRLHAIQLGRPVDLLLDREGLRVLGLDVHCGDDIHRFLPLPTAVVSAEEIAIRSPFVLLEEDELAFYRARSFALGTLRGRAVEHRGRAAGTLRDVVVGTDGALSEVIVAGEGGAERVIPFDDSVRIHPQSRSAA